VGLFSRERRLSESEAIEMALHKVMMTQLPSVDDSEYMAGLYNGLALAQSIVTGIDPVYVTPPRTEHVARTVDVAHVISIGDRVVVGDIEGVFKGVHVLWSRLCWVEHLIDGAPHNMLLPVSVLSLPPDDIWELEHPEGDDK